MSWTTTTTLSSRAIDARILRTAQQVAAQPNAGQSRSPVASPHCGVPVVWSARAVKSRSDLTDALATVDALEAEGKFLEAIDVLNSANRQQRDAEIERRLVRVRHLAFEELRRS